MRFLVVWAITPFLGLAAAGAAGAASLVGDTCEDSLIGGTGQTRCWATRAMTAT